MTPEFLQRVSVILVWVAFGSAVLAALATGARSYIERHERRLSSERQAAENRRRDGELEKAQQRLRDAEEARKQLEKEVAASRSELETVKKQTAPRHVTHEQRSRLVQELRRDRFEVTVACRVNDGEALDFANEFAATFNEAGWSIAFGHVNPTVLDPFRGLRVFKGPNANGATLGRLTSALRAAEIGFETRPIAENQIGQFQPDAVYLVVGLKP